MTLLTFASGKESIVGAAFFDIIKRVIICCVSTQHQIIDFSEYSIVFWRNSLKVDFMIYLRSLNAQQFAA